MTTLETYMLEERERQDEAEIEQLKWLLGLVLKVGGET
jgi:hypothetical protein